MPFVAANGLQFHVQELGAGPSVVMVHGLLIGNLASWYFTAAPALAENHRVLVYDLRGHGRSQQVADGYGTHAMAEDLAAIASAGGSADHPVDVVGHSWGALVALRFAIAHPARVRRLVLVEAPLPPSSMTEMAAFLDADPAHLLDAVPAQLRAAIGANGRRGERLLRSLEFLVTRTTLLADLRAERDPEDAELAGIRCPCLVIYGDRSSCAPAGPRLARAIPGARHAVLPGGHYLHLDARAELTRLIAEHLDG